MLAKLQKFRVLVLDEKRLAVWTSSLLVVIYGLVVLGSLLALFWKPLPPLLWELLKVWIAPFSSLTAYALRRLWQSSQLPADEEQEQAQVPSAHES
jgi:hypothetical protein